MYDAIIIGAGLSGLAAGVRLAHFGARVCILERHTTIGGLNSFFRLDGRDFDVGLHALTNFAPPHSRRGPLARVFKQLRLDWDQWPLAEQIESAIVFPGVELRFSNDFGLLEAEIARAFPGEAENFRRLCGGLVGYEAFAAEFGRRSARRVLDETFNEPLLREMLLCPLLFYGSASEGDMDYALYSILFRSVFLEGLARPKAGIRLILKTLVRKFKSLGGELRLRAGVARLALAGPRVDAVVLDDGSSLAARWVISSAGWPETARLCDPSGSVQPAAGRISFVESTSILDRAPAALGHRQTIVFFNDSPRFEYRRPSGLVDPRSGVVCSPNLFRYDEPLEEGVVRVSALANHDGWAGLDAESYRLAKAEWYAKIIDSAVRFVPDFRAAVVGGDFFTPRTIRRFTGHDGGTIYGSPDKRPDGGTHLQNLLLCGNDQGLVGIVGAMLSGIGAANRSFAQT